jgi:ABC-type branched-subunit amino acid transport system ATPase component
MMSPSADQPTAIKQPILRVDGLTKRFEGLCAVDHCSFELSAQAIHGLIGPNGSGKTTLFNLITGLAAPTEGRVFFRSEDITGLPSYEITRRGIVRTFQLVQVFPKMTVLENLLVGAQRQRGESVLHGLLQTSATRQESARLVDKAMALLSVTGLHRLADTRVRDLPYAEQKMIEVMRALMADPALILLDEPTSGLQPSLVDGVLDYIRHLRDDEGKTFVVVEHNMRLIMNVCEEVIVLNAGKKIAQGSPEQISRDPEVVRAYLGV